MKKAKRVKKWVKRLAGNTGACHGGMLEASRFSSPTEAWLLTNRPYDLLWALQHYSDQPDTTVRATFFMTGWMLAKKTFGRDRSYSDARLCRAMRARFPRPIRFA